MVSPSPSPDPNNEDACRMAAARLQHDHQHWLIMWGCYTRNYIAFPLFAAPRGTIITATSPDELPAKMRRQERLAGVRVPPPSPAPDQQGRQSRQGTQDWGRRALPRTR
jgi:hypothetical protein